MKFAFFCVVGVHVAALMVALLSQGCKRESSTGDTSSTTYGETNLPPLPFDTNISYAAPSNVPPQVPVETLTPSSQQEYVIQKGDSFSSIAKKYPGVTVKAIQEANPGVDPLKMTPGKKIVIPAATTAAMVKPNGTGALPADATGEVVYVVKSGDRLELIAKKYGITAKAIAEANNLKTLNKIVVGQKLKIPVKAQPPAPVDNAPPAVPPAR